MSQVFLCRGIAHGIVPDLSFFSFKSGLTPTLYQGTDYFCLQTLLKVDPEERYYLGSVVSGQLFERRCLWLKTSCRELSSAPYPRHVASWFPK